MGYLRKEEVQVIEVMGQKIKIAPLSYGKRKAIQTSFMKMNPRTLDMEVDNENLFKMDDTLHLNKIKDWDLLDEDNNKLPITMHTIEELLEPSFVTALFAEINKVLPETVTEDEKKS
jgi:hypothetical protein